MVKRLVRGVEHHLITMNSFKECFTQENWEAYYSLVIEGIVRPWEKLILTDTKFAFTELGALRFDKDWRSVSAFLSTLTTSGEVRDKFARLQQSECRGAVRSGFGRHGVAHTHTHQLHTSCRWTKTRQRPTTPIVHLSTALLRPRQMAPFTTKLLKLASRGDSVPSRSRRCAA